MTLNDLIDAFAASQPFDRAAKGRQQYWRDVLGHRPAVEITPDEVDQALAQLMQRGRLKAGRNLKTHRTGKPLAPSTVNRYLGELACIMKHGRKLRVLPRDHVSPTRGAERLPEQVRHDRFFTEAEVEQLLRAAKEIDRTWRKLHALILVAYHTGLRKRDLLNLKWSQVSLCERTLTYQTSKNGEPFVSVLSESATYAIASLPRSGPYVFGKADGKPMQDVRHLWKRITKTTGLSKPFHVDRTPAC